MHVLIDASDTVLVPAVNQEKGRGGKGKHAEQARSDRSTKKVEKNEA